MQFFSRNLALVAILGMFSACSPPAHVDAPQIPMGDFRLGHNIVVVNEPEEMPFSRNATDEEWKEAMTAAIDQRFGAYEGDKIYHLGVKVEAFALAVPGVPVLFTPKSVLVLAVNIWDDAAGEKLSEEAESFTIFESITPETMVSSGLTQNKEKQMTILTQNAAKAIQVWILEHPEWVGLPPLEEGSSPKPTVIEPADTGAEQAADSEPPAVEDATGEVVTTEIISDN